MAHWNRIAVPPRRRSSRAAIASLRSPVNSASRNSSKAFEAISSPVSLSIASLIVC